MNDPTEELFARIMPDFGRMSRLDQSRLLNKMTQAALLGARPWHDAISSVYATDDPSRIAISPHEARRLRIWLECSVEATETSIQDLYDLDGADDATIDAILNELACEVDLATLSAELVKIESWEHEIPIFKEGNATLDTNDPQLVKQILAGKIN